MNKFNLGGTWHLIGGKYDTEGKIPGSVYSILKQNNLLIDPHFRLNETEVFNILNDDFTFERHFDFENYKSNKILLCFEGLDTVCEVYLNGELILSSKNMHISHEVDVTGKIISKNNHLKVICYSPIKYVDEAFKKEYIFGSRHGVEGYGHLRKAHAMFGWDWGIRMPDAGIWKSVYILYDVVDKIKDFDILQHHENGKVYIEPKIESENNLSQIEITANSPNGEKLTFKNGEKTEIKNPMLWWPNGYGKQYLYAFTITLKVGDAIADEKTIKIGLKDLKLIREKDEYGESFYFRINGIDIFGMGADYVPEDNILSTITRERSEQLIKDCVFANFNTIRIWGGGYYPEDYFYDLCDEYGILLFHDMMFACTQLPDSDELIRSIEIEVEQNLKRMRTHACIAIVSGNNEIEELFFYDKMDDEEHKKIYLKVFEDVMPKAIAKYCPYIPYVPSSPSSFGGFKDPQNENFGDSHFWAVWLGNKPFSEYRNHYFRYLSEFGFESFPDEKTVNSFSLPEDRNPFSRVMEFHQRCNNGNLRILNYLAQTFKFPTDFSVLIYASQLLQAEAIKFAVEHLRRNRGRCMGTLYWQLNDIWPVASWSSVDYYGRYKALHYVAKRFYEPLMVACAETGEHTTRTQAHLREGHPDYQTKALLFVCNETANIVKGKVKWELKDGEDKVIKKGVFDAEIKPYSTLSFEEIDFNKTDVNENHLYYAFEVDKKVVSSGSVIFASPKYFNFKDPNLKVKVVGDTIEVESAAYAKYVQIYSDTDDFVVSDNFFDMEKGVKQVKIISGNAKNVKVRSVYDIK